MTVLTLRCPQCGGSVDVPIEADVTEYVCTHCGESNPIAIDIGGPGMSDSLIGATVADWDVREKIGDGTFGAVYKAFDRNLQRHVAFKVMMPSLAANPEFVKRFLREGITAAQLKHPNIVFMHRVGRDEKHNLHFLVMEFLEGRTLLEIVADTGPLCVDEAVDIFIQCADALAAAQDKNIIHRDIEPGNIMIDATGTAKITDFGLAKILSDNERSMKIMTTPHFMSPEQFQNRTLDARSDIYALGVTLYFALAGERPHDAPSTVQVINGILTAEPRPLKLAAPGTPDAIVHIVNKMIAKKPEDRHQDFRTVKAELFTYQTECPPQQVTCPSCGSTTYEGRRTCRHCSAELALACPGCGHEEAVGAKFCGECGADLRHLA